MGCCLIFPGQGSQFPGMSRGLDVAGLVPGRLSRLMDEGPADQLDRTVNAQPSVLAVSVLLWRRCGLLEPDFVLGHSLGEYTALVAAGCLGLEEALELVGMRAEFMEASSPPGKGGMAAVVGLDPGVVEDVCRGFDDLWVANLNGASQVVIAGGALSLKAAVEPLRERGARRVVPLKVTVASHCPFMNDASAALREYLGGVELMRPSCPVISNVTAAPADDPDALRELLWRQLTSPVRFEESVRKACALGVDRFVEIGPRSVLAPLVRRIAPSARVDVVVSG